MKLIFIATGMVNQQNCKYWENSTKDHCTAKKMTVWGAVGKATIIGPYFLEDNNGNIVTANFEYCIEMVNNFFVPEL